ncbi:MAG: glycosyltransferase family 61 protein, partial [Paracoccaceae bacterium]
RDVSPLNGQLGAAQAVDQTFLRDAYLKSFASLARSQSVPEALWVTDNFASNYYHWFCECLPRVFLARQFLKDVHVLLPESLAGIGFVTESLQSLAGVTYEFVPYSRSALVGRLWSVDLPSPKNTQRPDFFPSFRRELLDHIAPAGAGDADRIYISRKNSGRRRLTNEATVRELLQANGFRPVEMELLTFREQVGLMRSCRIVVSPHGAGLTNMMFMDCPGAVIEIRQDRNPKCFVGLASVCGHIHISIPAVPENSSVAANRADLEVSLSDLERAISSLVQGPFAQTNGLLWAAD